MLVLKRRSGEGVEIRLGEGVGVRMHVLRTASGSISLGIEAPDQVRIVRLELAADVDVQEEGKAA